MDDFPVSASMALACLVVGASIGLVLTFWAQVENLPLFMVYIWGGLLPLGLLGIGEANRITVGASVGFAHGLLFLVASFLVASVRFGRDSSPRFDITVVDILVAAAIYTLLFSIPGDVTI
jgi:ABC-type xylose transport system permease subunit